MSGATLVSKFVGSDLYVGGYFTSFAGLNGTTGIVRLNSTNQWQSVGGGLYDYSGYSTTTAMMVNGSDLYVGGNFEFVAGGNLTANAIARWDGSNWFALGYGIGSISTVNAFALSGNNLFVAAWGGGSFILKWDASTASWTDLSSGVNKRPQGIAIIGGVLYVAGLFTSIGGIAANYAAKYNFSTSTWSSLGVGLGNSVYTMHATGTEIWFSGPFLTAGGINATRIARFNTFNSSWSTIRSGLDGYAWAFESDAPNSLYLGGEFVNAGGVTVNHTAWTDGINFYDLEGSNGIVEGLNFANNKLYVAGSFSSIGNLAANNLATYQCTAPYCSKPKTWNGKPTPKCEF